ncbi:MAG: DUF1963 domain-containing protein, partial [Alphaproteobacteria bacterium]|nr:DUF1963 domain-containing protein [Alphaproteobacteria bacterium]
LPANLWAGLGPRHGWLLLFVDPNQGVPEGSDAFRVLHVDALGAEREVPRDLSAVYDGVYTGPAYDHFRSIADIPSTWRRWPVDVVVVPNEIREEEGRTLAAPPNFAQILYEDRPVAPDKQRPSDPEPFSWRGALYVVDSIERSLAKPLSELRIPDKLVERLNQPGYIGTIVPALDAEDAQWEQKYRALLEGPAPQDETARQRRTAMLAHVEQRRIEREKLAAFLARHPKPDSIIDSLRRSDDERRLWRAGARTRIAAERSAIAAHDLDSPIPAEAWKALEARLRQDKFRTWTFKWVDRNGESLHVSFEETDTTIFARHRTGMKELVADYYTDAKRKTLIPEAILAEFEPYWRTLYNNRPHRMGGYHDGLQSDARIGPAKELLLFQIATDDAMNWCWGDAGAYYVFINPDDLKKLDFSGARMDLECH